MVGGHLIPPLFLVELHLPDPIFHTNAMQMRCKYVHGNLQPFLGPSVKAIGDSLFFKYSIQVCWTGDLGKVRACFSNFGEGGGVQVFCTTGFSSLDASFSKSLGLIHLVGVSCLSNFGEGDKHSAVAFSLMDACFSPSLGLTFLLNPPFATSLASSNPSFLSLLLPCPVVIAFFPSLQSCRA